MPEGFNPIPESLRVSTTPEGERHPETSALRGSADPRGVKLAPELRAKFSELEVDMDCCGASIECGITGEFCEQMQSGRLMGSGYKPEGLVVTKLPEMAYARGCAECPVFKKAQEA